MEIIAYERCQGIQHMGQKGREEKATRIDGLRVEISLALRFPLRWEAPAVVRVARDRRGGAQGDHVP